MRYCSLRATIYSSCLKSGRRWLLALILLHLAASPFAFALGLPKLQGYVNDYAGMISPAVRAQIEKDLRAFEEADSTQIVILTIPSLQGEVLEQFSIKVAEAWKVGQKGKDNGIILLAAKKERKIRIEVGRGLEAKLTDLKAGRIIDNVIRPRFKANDFNGGFSQGIKELISATRGEFSAAAPTRPLTPPLPSRPKSATTAGDEAAKFFFSALVVPVCMYLASLKFTNAPLAIGPAAYPLFSLLQGEKNVGALIFVAFLGMIVGLIVTVVRLAIRDRLLLNTGSSGRYGGSGGSSSGGGSSGGGGSFGGGGASGDW